MSKPQEESPFHCVASTSRKVLEDEKPSLPSDKILTVTLLSCEWKSSKDGLSTISRELAIQLAEHPDVEVYVYLPKCSEEDKNVAGRHSVQLIEAEELPGFEPIDWLASLPKGHLPHCLIGHGIHLGRQIPLIKRHHDCKWIQVVHTAPEELGMYRSYEEAIFKGGQEHQAEVKLCERADQVVAVGPKLADAYSRYLRFSRKDQDVINLTPSIFTEFLSIQQATEERGKFSVLVFGRGDSEDFHLKGYDIAVQAVAELKDSSYQLMFVGAPAGKEDEVTQKLLQHGIPPSQLTVRRFKDRREELARLFCEVDLAIMPSRTEGFGLTALEALSAGLPVLVSGNSGLGDALKKVFSGFSHVVDSEDPKEWAKAISIVRRKGRQIRLEEANLLREKYALKYSWKKQCDCLVEKMLHLSFASADPLPEGTVTGEVSGATAKTGDSGDSTGVRKAPKQENVNPNPERGILSWKTHCVSATSRNPEEQDPQEKREEVNRYMVQRIDEVKETFDLSSFTGLRRFYAYLVGELQLTVVSCERSSIKITVRCRTLKILEGLWDFYLSGRLNAEAEKCLITEKIKDELGMETIKLATTILEEDYLVCKLSLMQTAENPLEQIGHQVKNVSEKLDSLRQSSQDEDKSSNDLQQLKSEVGNVSDKLDTLMAQREVEDEGQF